MKHLKKRKNQRLQKNDLHSPKTAEEIIDETLEETFPASDAPSWYGGKDSKKTIQPLKK
ncbi:hypothetical protein ACNVED_03765 [Legionella sp. D16C41]|uniref:hypothetical protein n=1 Tax=Legionella sp. D16C41 TaxID=3402688 RepID=UPI003AF68F1E